MFLIPSVFSIKKLLIFILKLLLELIFVVLVLADMEVIITMLIFPIIYHL